MRFGSAARTKKSKEGYPLGFSSNNKVTGVTDTNGNILANAYDIPGRLTSATRTTPTLSAKTVSYGYDKASNRTTLTWPDGYAATYAYDALNHPITVTDSGGTVLASYSYDPLARRSKVQYNGSAGAAMTYTWSPESDLNALNNDFAGTANDVTFTNTFSPAHQWTTAAISNGAFAYIPAATSGLTYSSNTLNQYTALNGTIGLSHDTRGNYTGGATPTIVYDAENHMMSLSATQTYAYDPNGRRTTKTMAGTTTNFIHDGDSEIAEYDGIGAGTLTRRFVPGAAIDEYVAMVTAAGAKTFFHVDKMGSVIAMSDMSGTLVEGPYTYDPYGSCFLGATACNHLLTSIEPFHFTGQRFDIENGTYYYRARIYSSLLGFYQVDPVGYKDNLNLYVYAQNDPTDLSDPTGLYDCKGGAADCAAVNRFVKAINTALGNLKPDSDAYKKVAAVATYLGKSGDGNGVTIEPTSLKGVVSEARQNNTIAIDLKKARDITSNGLAVSFQ